MLRSLAPAAVAGILSATAPALANDSTAALGAGGLTLTQSADVRMASEDLFISREQVRVRYSFVNDSAVPITTRVAFPLPEANLQELGETDLNIPSTDGVNIVNFAVTVDGRAVRPDLEQKAFFKGQEVTELLRRTGAPLGYPGQDFNNRLMRLPAGARQELARRGLVEFSGDMAQAMWTVKNIFYWQQTFPAGRPLAVEHSYKPIVGGSFIPSTGFFENPKAYRSDDFAKRYCVDDGTYAGIAQRLRAAQKRTPGQTALMMSWYVDYVLTTGRNWKGPIGRFRLTVDKGHAENLISFCMDGVRKSGATTFVVEKRDFEPERDLHILIVEPPRQN